jgi:hypothetical protein
MSPPGSFTQKPPSIARAPASGGGLTAHPFEDGDAPVAALAAAELLLPQATVKGMATAKASASRTRISAL